jgi:2-furoyl-CoA dehydrogenase large subunit
LTYAVQVHACVLEIDRETGVVDLVDYAAVDDAGTRLDPQLVEAHVRRATAHALGTALGVRQALDAPPLARASTESPSPVTPLGAKGLGDGGGAGIHAVCAALQDALRGAGGGVVAVSRHDPARVWELLRAPAASRALVQVVSR